MIWNNVIWAGLGRHAKKVDCSARGRLHIFISWHEYLQNLVPVILIGLYYRKILSTENASQ